MVAVAAALTVGGVALAQSESGGSSAGTPGPPSGKRMAPPMLLGGPGGKDLTYAEMHVQHNGQARADHGRLLQVVSNLLENAIRVSPEGGTVAVAATPGEIRISDEGPGIPAEEIPHAFERSASAPAPDTALRTAPASAWR